MEKAQRDTLFCGTAADCYFRSEDLLLAHFENFIQPDDIPDDLLQSWIEDEPIRMLMEFVDEKNYPEFSLSYAIYARAYELHDLHYEKIRKRPFRTSVEKKMLNFIRYQELLQIIARFRARQMAPPPFQVFHFMDYKMTYPVIKAYAEFHLHEK